MRSRWTFLPREVCIRNLFRYPRPWVSELTIEGIRHTECMFHRRTATGMLRKNSTPYTCHKSRPYRQQISHLYETIYQKYIGKLSIARLIRSNIAALPMYIKKVRFRLLFFRGA